LNEPLSDGIHASDKVKAICSTNQKSKLLTVLLIVVGMTITHDIFDGFGQMDSPISS
jgi:hypothetical protein